MTIAKPATPATSQRMTAGDLIPTMVVVAVTAVANAGHYLQISVPGAVLSLVMIAVTVHPQRTLRGLAGSRGVCRACGLPGSARDPLTVVRRPRVHVRHLPNIRASVRATRQAARDAEGGVS